MSDNLNSAWMKRCLMIVVLIGTLLLVGMALKRLDERPRTDDAYAYADTINVTPQVNGNIVELAVRENQQVEEGDVLFRIDPRAYEHVLAQAQASRVALDQQIMLTQRSVDAQKLSAQASNASIVRAQAVARQAGDTLRRNQGLVAKGFVSADAIDQLGTAEKSARAELEVTQLQAKQAYAGISGVDALEAQRGVIDAQIASAKLNLEYTVVRAPFSGRIVGLTTAVGQYASAGHPLFNMIDTRQWFVIANFRETELAGMRPGTRCVVYLMADTSRPFNGSVSSVGYGVFPDDGGAQVNGLPRVARSINWVRVSQRFPVRIKVDAPGSEFFRLGASAVAVVAVPPEQPADRQSVSVQ
jgi:multidrug efflux system membrane fusion protein